jgi:uncharacterized membrane protein YhaH (DUF805 family)
VRPAERTWPAALTLFVIAALIPESIATFNSPPLLLLTRPYVLLFLCAFYGSVALLVREFIRRRSPRWAAVLLLGAAAGAVNEGVIAGTWYKVQYPGYALVGALDPAVAVGLTVFHALVSTVLPILLAELMFPQIASRPWLESRARAGFVLLLALTAATGFVPAAHRTAKLLVLLMVIAAVATALKLHAPTARARPRVRPPRAGPPRGSPPRAGPPRAGPPRADPPVPGPALLYASGAAAIVVFYAIFAFVPAAIAHAVPAAARPGWQAVPALLMTGLFGGVVALARNWSARPGWGQAETLAVITGVLVPPAVLSVLLPGALAGLEPLATVPMLAVLLWLRSRLRARLRA